MDQEADDQLKTRHVYHTIYGKQVMVSARAMDLSKGERLRIARDPSNGAAVKMVPENENLLEPFERHVGDELDWAELEFGMGVLDDYLILRGPGEASPNIVKAGDLKYKRTY